MTHGSIPPAERALLGIGDDLVRLSCGVEDADDLVADIERGLKVAIYGATAVNSKVLEYLDASVNDNVHAQTESMKGVFDQDRVQAVAPVSITL